ncbi:hypothetical protein F5884DRAFT_680551 [Xylogone sp. PMI_703]|nr:hypothetical protein F5884DRAFT_680551 [Xylogone sp. PMI_703]
MEESSTRTIRQRRASKPKVKTGCNNCKSRRVKCDETRPQCNRCVKSGRVCDGYPAYNPRNRSADVIPILPRPPQNGASSSTSGTSPAPLLPSGSSNTPTSLFTSRTLVRRLPRQRQPKRPPSLIGYTPSVSISFNAQESLYFQLFREHTATELSGFFNSNFWTRDVLQESHSEASIRHAVVALGALYKTLEKSCESPPGSPDDGTVVQDTATDHFKFALQQYGKSLAQLREALANKEVRSQRTILMSIVLFTCFSSFTGDHQAAIFQVQSGLSLLEERRQNQIQAFNDRNDPVEDELIQMFTRLAIQAKSYDMAFHFPAPYVIRLSPNSAPSSPQSPPSPSDSTSTSASADATIPELFSSVQEARLSLDALVERILRYQEALTSFYTAPDKIIPSQLRSSGIGYRAQLEQWSAAFKPILERRRALGVSNTERAGIIVLRMSFLNAWILFVMGFSTSEMDFDKFMPEFREVVDLAREIVVDEELSLAMKKCGNHPNCHHRQNSQQHNHYHEPQASYRDEHDYNHIKASFALDLGIVPSLFVVGTKCRDRRLRREAIKLLFTSPRREGMWDSMLSGHAARWIMHNEEEHLAPYSAESAGQVVPEDKRVMVKEILFDLQKREATLRCGTRGKAGEVDTRARETTIYW